MVLLVFISICISLASWHLPELFLLLQLLSQEKSASLYPLRGLKPLRLLMLVVWVFHTPPISQVLNCRTLFLFYGKFFHRFPSFPLLPHPTTESLHDKEDTKPRKVMASKEMLENLSPTNKHYESGIVPRVMRIYWLSSLGKKKNIWLCRIFTIEFFSFFLSSSERNLQRKGKTGISSSLWTLERKEKNSFNLTIPG